MQNKIENTPTATSEHMIQTAPPDHSDTYFPPRRQSGPKRPMKPEVLYAAAIKAGHVRVVRRRGKPPQIIWITDVR